MLNEGLRLSGEWMVLYVLPSEQGIRVGFVCGRGLGGAVLRNRCRRRLKEAWRSVSSRARGGFDIVVVARPKTLGTRAAALTEELAGLLASVGVVSA